MTVTWGGGHIVKVAWPTCGNQDASFDKGFARALRFAHGDESGDEPPIVGNAQFLAGFNSREVSRRVLP